MYGSRSLVQYNPFLLGQELLKGSHGNIAWLPFRFLPYELSKN